MNVYASDQEQIQLIRDWWKKYGSSVILGLTIAIVGSFGWRYWQQHTTARAQQASALYEQMLAMQMTHQQPQFNLVANNLIKNYTSTPYATLAGLMQADNAISQQDLSIATQKLQWVSQHAKDNKLKQIATIRLARVLLAQNQPQQALQVLQKVHDKSFMSAVNIVKGDALVATGDKNAARIAYQNALDNLPENATIRPLVQMKLNDLL